MVAHLCKFTKCHWVGHFGNDQNAICISPQNITGKKTWKNMCKNYYYSEKYWEANLKEKKVKNQPGSEAGYCKRMLPHMLPLRQDQTKVET